MNSDPILSNPIQSYPYASIIINFRFSCCSLAVRSMLYVYFPAQSSIFTRAARAMTNAYSRIFILCVGGFRLFICLLFLFLFFFPLLPIFCVSYIFCGQRNKEQHWKKEFFGFFFQTKLIYPCCIYVFHIIISKITKF